MPAVMLACPVLSGMSGCCMGLGYLWWSHKLLHLLKSQAVFSNFIVQDKVFSSHGLKSLISRHEIIY